VFALGAAAALAAVIGVGVAAVGFGWLGLRPRPAATVGAGDPAQVAFGRRVYAEHCASCHGANLEGQPEWRSRRPDGRLPAPPHDVSGHTWHHPDGVLFRITKHGPAAIVGEGYASDMPGFAGVLSDAEIRAALAFIKSTWPDREREFQERQSRAERGEAAR
jgi:mono/diheme cytochrome c family protein